MNIWTRLQTKKGYRLNRWMLPEIPQLEGGKCIQKWTLKLARKTSSCYDDNLCHKIFKSHHKQLSYGPETNLLQVRLMTLTLKVANRILSATCLVKTINCTKQYLNSTINNKVMAWNNHLTIICATQYFNPTINKKGMTSQRYAGWTMRRLFSHEMVSGSIKMQAHLPNRKIAQMRRVFFEELN